MKYLVLIFLLAGCTATPTKFAAPAKGDPIWDLNVGLWPGSPGN
jgi:hypothetical protein